MEHNIEWVEWDTLSKNDSRARRRRDYWLSTSPNCNIYTSRHVPNVIPKAPMTVRSAHCQIHQKAMFFTDGRLNNADNLQKTDDQFWIRDSAVWYWTITRDTKCALNLQTGATSRLPISVHCTRLCPAEASDLFDEFSAHIWYSRSRTFQSVLLLFPRSNEFIIGASRAWRKLLLA